MKLRLIAISLLTNILLVGCGGGSTSKPDTNSTDTVAPTIKIVGKNPLAVTQGQTFSDPGATAKDNVDGTVRVVSTGKVDMNTKGSYKITYTATDKAGNKATAKRTVLVNSADVVWEVSNMSEFRQALEDAAANGENDKIILAKGTYNVTSDKLGTLTFDDNEAFNLTIVVQEGLSSKDVILDGNNSTQVFNFNNTESSTLTLKNLSIVHGKTSGSGAVYTSQNIKIEDCNISNNSGRGLYSRGTTSIGKSTMSHNNTPYDGGAFYSEESITITNSTISNNSSYVGGGFSSDSTTTVTNSTISNNSSRHSGGFSSYGTTILTNSIFSENSSTSGAIFESSNSHNSYISNNTFVKNKGSKYLTKINH